MTKIFALAGALLLCTGCSSFNREWKSALSQPTPRSEISGPWQGRWLSDKNGHTGKLRAVLTKVDSDTYEARFHATFWMIFRASYRVPLRGREENGVHSLIGTADLGWLGGGVYEYEADVTPDRFFSTYKSKHDHGTFEMERPSDRGAADLSAQ